MTRHYHGVKWIAFDGEAIDGRYVQLVDSLGHVLANPEGLSSAECLRFVTRKLPRSASWRRCLFGMTFDVHHWIADFPTEDRIRFLAGETVTYISGEEGWSLEWIGQRILTVTPHGTKADKLKFWDVYYWFGTSFIRACEDWDVDVPEIVRVGKASRSDLSTFTAEQLADYSITECRQLSDLMVRVSTAISELPGSPSLLNWHGPGALASHYLRKSGARHQLRDFSGSHIGPELFDAFARAYHGGRIEQRVAGTVGPVWRYDLRSAYAWGAYHLGPVSYQWVPETSFQPEPWAKMSVWRVTWDVPDSAEFGPFPWRAGKSSRDSIVYPQRGEGWYWWPEVKAALTVWGHRNVKVHEGYTARGGGRQTQVAMLVQLLYTARMAWRGSPHETLLKRALVAIYGKFSQRRGRDGWPGFFYCLPWAGWITASVRAALLLAVQNNMDAVIAFTTDGIITSRELPGIKLADRLGGWRVDRFEQGTFIVPGLYRLVDADGQVIEAKTRGFERAEIDWERALDQLNAAKPMEVYADRFIGHGLADHWPTKFGAHRLHFRPFKITINPFITNGKRAGAKQLLAAGLFDWRTMGMPLGIQPGDERGRMSAVCRLPAAWAARAETWEWEDDAAAATGDWERVERRQEALVWNEILDDWTRDNDPS